MSAITVWTGNIADAPQLQELEANAFGEKSWGADNVAGSFTAPGVEVLLAGRAGNAAQGFLVWRAVAEEAEILTLGVHPDARKKGLAGALLRKMFEKARASGRAAIFLEVGADNIAAISLYRNCGFREVGRRHAYYRDGADAVLMRVDL